PGQGPSGRGPSGRDESTKRALVLLTEDSAAAEVGGSRSRSISPIQFGDAVQPRPRGLHPGAPWTPPLEGVQRRDYIALSMEPSALESLMGLRFHCPPVSSRRHQDTTC